MGYQADPANVLFRFKSADGTDSSLFLSHIFGFGETCQFNPAPAGFKSEITLAVGERLYHFGSSEAVQDLQDRFEVQIAELRAYEIRMRRNLDR